MKPIQKLWICFFCFITLSVGGLAEAKLTIAKQDKSFDLATIEAIAIPPYTSEKVDFGKVAPDRMPKIEALLGRNKKEFRSYVLNNTKSSKEPIFYGEVPNKKDSTVILKINFDQFDNGNQMARMVPFAGKAKVTLRAGLYNAKTNSLILEMTSQIKGKEAGLVDVPGGLDADVLRNATFEANNEIFTKIVKLAKFKDRGMKIKWDYSALIKGSLKEEVSSVKEEGRELDSSEKK